MRTDVLEHRRRLHAIAGAQRTALGMETGYPLCAREQLPVTCRRGGGVGSLQWSRADDLCHPPNDNSTTQQESLSSFTPACLCLLHSLLHFQPFLSTAPSSPGRCRKSQPKPTPKCWSLLGTRGPSSDTTVHGACPFTSLGKLPQLAQSFPHKPQFLCQLGRHAIHNIH